MGKDGVTTGALLLGGAWAGGGAVVLVSNWGLTILANETTPTGNQEGDVWQATSA